MSGLAESLMTWTSAPITLTWWWPPPPPPPPAFSFSLFLIFHPSSSSFHPHLPSLFISSFSSSHLPSLLDLPFLRLFLLFLFIIFQSSSSSSYSFLLLLPYLASLPSSSSSSSPQHGGDASVQLCLAATDAQPTLHDRQCMAMRYRDSNHGPHDRQLPMTSRSILLANT